MNQYMDYNNAKSINQLTSVGPPEFLHSVPHQHNTREFCEGLNDVEVAQRTDLKERHAVLFCVSPCLLGRNLALESKMKPVAHQDPGHTWGMLMETSNNDGTFTFIQLYFV